MNDQASVLRERRARAPRREPCSGTLTPAIVVGSGKGGVGKSVLSVMLAAALARRGSNVLLLDGAQNQGNLHVLLGRRPEARLAAVLEEDASPAELIVPLAENLSLLAADSGAESVQALTPTDRARLHLRLTALYGDYDVVIVDAGSGVDGVIRAAATRASRMVVVAVPEPTSLSDAYASIKLVHLQAPALPIDLLVNRTEDDAEGPAVHERLALATRRFLRRELGWLGSVPERADLRLAARRPGSLLETGAGALAEVVERLAAAERLDERAREQG